MTTETFLPKSHRAPHNIDEHTWWYRNARGGMTLVREERDSDGKWIRTVSYNLTIHGGAIRVRKTV